MQRLHPTTPGQSADVDTETFRSDLAVESEWVALGMVASVDGAASVAGTSGQLGGEGDRLSFRSLRDACDVILVGAGTARDENYGPPRPSERVQQARLERGQAPVPSVAVVTRSPSPRGLERLLTDASSSAETSAQTSVFVITSAVAPTDHLGELEAHGVVTIVAGEQEVDLTEAVAQLRARGLRRVLCEGGPSLNAAMLAAGVVDDIFTTVAPTAVGGSSPRIVAGTQESPQSLELVDVHLHGGDLLLHHRVLGPHLDS